MDGVQLLRRLQQIRPATPTILISGYGDRALLSQAYAAGAVDFVFKPIDQQEFLITVRRSLHLARLRSLIVRQEQFMASCRAQSLERIEVLRAHVEARARAVETTTLPDAFVTAQQSRDAKSQTLADRANRSLARLEVHFDWAIKAYQETLAKLMVAEETCHRVADEKLMCLR
jgi:FixJ family two-component response regulator